MDDPDWRAENAKDVQNKLESFYNFARTIIDNPGTDEKSDLEKWLISTLQNRIAEVTTSLEEMRTRTAVETALFEVWNDFRWYVRRKDNTNTHTLQEALKIWLKLLAPFAPHVCEELWSQMHEEGFVSQEKWPQVEQDLIDASAERQENLIEEVVDDTLNVLKATKIEPKKICYYTASRWKWKIYLRMLEQSTQGELKLSEIMKDLAAEKDLRNRMKDVAKFTPKIAKELAVMPDEQKKTLLKNGVFDEYAALSGAKGFLSDRFKADVLVYAEDDEKRFDPKQKSGMAVPMRPAIYVE
jgi:leucyl-tRNA synthetase